MSQIGMLSTVNDAEFEEILMSHVVDPHHMYGDDFYGFFNQRKESIHQKIEEAMGKKINREQQKTDGGEYVNTEEYDE
jgi:hypothetical protein